MTVSYQTWAKLNIHGRKEWGNVFKDDKVPIKRISTQRAKFQGARDRQSTFEVDWTALSTDVQTAVIDRLSRKTGTPKNQVLKEILTVGLPLRSSLVQNVGTNKIELLPMGPKDTVNQWLEGSISLSTPEIHSSPMIRRSTRSKENF